MCVSLLQAGPEMHTMAKFLLELSLTDYHCLKFKPSQLAATALYIACKICSDGEWVRMGHRKLFELSDVYSRFLVVHACVHLVMACNVHNGIFTHIESSQ